MPFAENSLYTRKPQKPLTPKTFKPGTFTLSLEHDRDVTRT